MQNKLSTSEAGQRLLSRVYQIISNTTTKLDAIHKETSKDEDKYRETINQKINVAKAKGQIYLSDINTLGEIFLANSQRQNDKLFAGSNLLINIQDLETLYNMLSDPKERKAFTENPHSQQATNVISFPK